MKSPVQNPWPDARFPSPVQREGGSPRGFVCILDLRPARDLRETLPRAQLLAWAALLAIAVYAAGDWSASRPAPVLRLNAAAVQISEWESPTGFLLTEKFEPLPPR